MPELAVGKVIRIPCMRAGLCAYQNETVYLTNASLEQLAQTAHGIPVVINHPDMAIDDNNVADLSVGRVSKFEFDPADQLWYAEFIVETEQAAKYLRDGWGVSTAWYGEEYGPGGTLNNVPYDRELARGRYEHLAIVDTPRYEMAKGARFLNSKPLQKEAIASKIECNSSLQSKGLFMLGRIWKKIGADEVKKNNMDEMHVDVDGKAVPLKNILGEMKEHEEKRNKKMLNNEDMVEVDGKKMNVGELVKAYKDMKSGSTHKAEGEAEGDAEAHKKEGEGDAHHKQEASAEEHKEEKKEASAEEHKEEKKEASAEEKKEEKKEASAEEKKEHDADAKKDEGDAKKNSIERFNALKETHENGVAEKPVDNFISTRERCDMGRARYGSKQ